ncbi:MAG: phosphate signaling complex protein PhoU [Anaerolineae bacterium]|nr:phosphate signaling complex protein PhoU [Anaerolineae bacterium]
MVRQVFKEQIEELLDDLLLVGQMVAHALDQSIQALLRQDVKLARQVIDGDVEVNAAQREIDEKCLVLIATQQPMAGDLRTLLAVTNIAAELERIGDYTEGIAKLAIRVAGQPFIKPLIDIPRMADESRQMLTNVLRAFADQDAEAACRVAACDTVVDNLYSQVFDDLMVIMMRDPQAIRQATYLLWVAHNLERIADRTTNIAERIVFVVSGQVVTLNQ